MTNCSSSVDYDELQNDSFCDVETLRDIELNSFIRNKSEREQTREKCFLSCTTCICLVIFITFVTYISMWLFEYYCNIYPIISNRTNTHNISF